MLGFCNLLYAQSCTYGQEKGEHKSTYGMSCPSKILLLEMTMQEQRQQCTSHEVLPMQRQKLQRRLSLQVKRECLVQN